MAGNGIVSALLSFHRRRPVPDRRSVGHKGTTGGGRPLEGTTRALLESRFGEDFRQIRVHTDARAAEAAATLDAAAYTTGRHIVFDAGQYAPHTTVGLHLLAHELAHVVQQRRGALAVAGSGDLEGEATSVATAVTGGGEGRVRLTAAVGTPQLAKKGRVRIQVIRDESKGVLRVVRVDERGRIVAGLAEIVPPIGTPLDEHAVEIPPEGAGREIRLKIPKEYAGSINPGQPVTLERRASEAELHEQMRKEYYEQLRQDLMLYARETGNEFGLGSDLAAQYIAASDEELERRAEDIGYDELRRVSSHYARLRSDLIEYAKHKRRQVEKEFGLSLGTDAETVEKYGDADLMDLKLVASDREFRAWREARDRAQEEAAEMRQARRAQAMFPPGFEFSPGEARAIVEGDEGETLRDEKTGKLIGHYTYKTAGKALGGAVGTVTRELRAPDGRLISSSETTVLTPTADVLQDLARNSPYVGDTITAIEAATGVSLDLRDYGRLLSAAERGERAVSTLPYGETVRASAEAALGLSLSFTDYGRVLSPEEREQRIAQVAFDLATMGVAKAKAKAGAGRTAGQPRREVPPSREAGAPTGRGRQPETAPPPPPARQTVTKSPPAPASGERRPGPGASQGKRAPPRPPTPAEKASPPKSRKKAAPPKPRKKATSSPPAERSPQATPEAEGPVPTARRAGGAGRHPTREPARQAEGRRQPVVEEQTVDLAEIAESPVGKRRAKEHAEARAREKQEERILEAVGLKEPEPGVPIPDEFIEQALAAQKRRGGEPPPPSGPRRAPRTESAAEFQARGGKITKLPPGPSAAEPGVRPGSASPGSLPEGTHRLASGPGRANQGPPRATGTSRKQKPDAGKAGKATGKRRRKTRAKKQGEKKSGRAKQGKAAGGKGPSGGGKAGAKPGKGATAAQQAPEPAVQVHRRESDGATVITSEVGPPQRRKGYEKELFPSVELDLEGWHRAHSHGAGTGTEVEAGILYAPPEVNLSLQNKGVEARIRELYQAKPPDTKLILTTETFAHPGTRRLKEIRYRVTAVRGEDTEIKFEASIEVQNKRTDPRIEVDMTFPTP